MYVCDGCADLSSLSSLVKLRSLNVSNQGYTQQYGYYDVHVLTGEWCVQSGVWTLGVRTSHVTADAHSCALCCAALLHGSYVLCSAAVAAGELGGAVVPGQQSDRCERRSGCVVDACAGAGGNC